MEWLNEPKEWKAEGEGKLRVRAEPGSDFWRVTHYGFVRDSGHFCYRRVSGNFTAQVKVTANYSTLYDQAGLMLRARADLWLKTGIEFVDGSPRVSAVVTRGQSDWSVCPPLASPPPPAAWFRVVRKGGTVEVLYSGDGVEFGMFRTLFLSEEEEVEVGMMAAAPQGDGEFVAEFDGFVVEALV